MAINKQIQIGGILKQPVLLSIFLLTLLTQGLPAQQRASEMGLQIGVLPAGSLNGITDVPGVSVGHHTLIKDSTVRTGLTVIKPHPGNLFQEKVPAAVYVGNGFGKLAGSTQVKELGNIEAPIVLTNTLSVGLMVDASVRHVLAQPGNEQVRSVNAVVGETNDGWLNDIRNPALNAAHLRQALDNATTGSVPEGNVGAGTGTVCFGFKGGIGTASRKIPATLGGYTVGVLVQSNFGGVLTIKGAPVGKELGKYFLADQLNQSADGSCMIVVATDAPLDARNLGRLASRALFGLARTGGIASNGSGDYVIAFSTHEEARIIYGNRALSRPPEVSNNAMSPLFLAVIEATEEAIINSLLMAETMEGFRGRTVEALPMEQVWPILEEYKTIKK